MSTAAAARSKALFQPVASVRERQSETNVDRAGVHPGETLQALAGNSAVSRLLGHGDSLPHGIREEMEARFGTSFDDVRVHAHPMAHAVAEALHAKAFTHGTDIVFGQGRYAPGATEGKHLLAHELAHVVQQRRGGPTPSGGSSSNEAAAESAAVRATQGTEPIGVDGGSAVGVARAELDEPAVGDDAIGALLDRFRRAVSEAILSGAQYGGPGNVLVAKAIEGLSDQCFQELWVDGRGKTIFFNFLSLGATGVMKAFAGYQIGLLEGLASPLTDVFGMAVFAENARNMLFSLAASAYNHADQLGPEIQQLLAKGDALAQASKEALRAFVNDPEALQTLLSLPQAANEHAQARAYELGRAGGSKIVSMLESPWPGEEGPEEEDAGTAPELGFSTVFSWLQLKGAAFHDWLIASPGAKIGEAVGYAVGFVAIQGILVAVTAGASGALELAGSALARLGTALARLTPTGGKAVMAAGRLVTLVDEASRTIGQALSAAKDPALRQLYRWIGPLLDKLGDVLPSLRSLLDKLRVSESGEDIAQKMLREEAALASVKAARQRTLQEVHSGPMEDWPDVEEPGWGDRPTEIFTPAAKSELQREARLRAAGPQGSTDIEDWPEVVSPAELEPSPVTRADVQPRARVALEVRAQAERAVTPDPAAPTIVPPAASRPAAPPIASQRRVPEVRTQPESTPASRAAERTIVPPDEPRPPVAQSPARPAEPVDVPQQSEPMEIPAQAEPATPPRAAPAAESPVRRSTSPERGGPSNRFQRQQVPRAPRPNIRERLVYEEIPPSRPADMPALPNPTPEQAAATHARIGPTPRPVEPLPDLPNPTPEQAAATHARIGSTPRPVEPLPDLPNPGPERIKEINAEKGPKPKPVEPLPDLPNPGPERIAEIEALRKSTPARPPVEKPSAPPPDKTTAMDPAARKELEQMAEERRYWNEEWKLEKRPSANPLEPPRRRRRRP